MRLLFSVLFGMVSWVCFVDRAFATDPNCSVRCTTQRSCSTKTTCDSPGNCKTVKRCQTRRICVRTCAPASEPIPTTPLGPETPASPPPPEVEPAPSPRPDAALKAGGPCGMNALEQDALSLVNQARRKAKRRALSCHPTLVQAARSWSRQMCQRRRLSHDRMVQRFRALRFKYRSIGENVAAGQSSAHDVVRSWMSSSGHRANILKKKFDSIGIGYVSCGDDLGHYWTQMFLQNP